MVFICGIAPNAGTSAVAIVRPVNIPRSIFHAAGHPIATSFEPGELGFTTIGIAK
jgi:hypothetical protein